MKSGQKFFWILLISVVAWFLSILLWPYALHGPVKNVIESYRVMAHFPSTFRQIFEGKVEWSDSMPWYYLPKSMANHNSNHCFDRFDPLFIFFQEKILSWKKHLYMDL